MIPSVDFQAIWASSPSFLPCKNYVQNTIAGSFMAILYRFGSFLYAAVSTCHIGLSTSCSASDVSKRVYIFLVKFGIYLELGEIILGRYAPLTRTAVSFALKIKTLACPCFALFVCGRRHISGIVIVPVSTLKTTNPKHGQASVFILSAKLAAVLLSGESTPHVASRCAVGFLQFCQCNRQNHCQML